MRIETNFIERILHRLGALQVGQPWLFSADDDRISASVSSSAERFLHGLYPLGLGKSDSNRNSESHECQTGSSALLRFDPIHRVVNAAKTLFLTEQGCAELLNQRSVRSSSGRGKFERGLPERVGFSRSATECASAFSTSSQMSRSSYGTSKNTSRGAISSHCSSVRGRRTLRSTTSRKAARPSTLVLMD